jgi:cardiolipin synthase C
MRPIYIVLILLAAFPLASFLALYSYGRFVKRVKGEPSFALPVSADETLLDRLIAPLVKQHPDQSGLQLLEDNLDAFAARALAARRAGRSLDLQYYMWKHDLTGLLLTNEVLKAADRGVRVRLLLDDLNTYGFDRTHVALDTHPNISVRLFNPSRNRDDIIRRGFEMLLRAFLAIRRMHNKAWIADGRLAIIGGRNNGDAYFDADASSNFRDLDVLVLGETVRQTEAIFDEFWNCDAAIPIAALKKPRDKDLAALRQTLARVLVDERVRPYLDRAAEDEATDAVPAGAGTVHWSRGAKVVSDPPQKASGGGYEDKWLMHAIRPLLLSAQSDLEITSPYFIPGEKGTEELARLVRKGVRVSVLTNSLAATDVAAVHGAYAAYRRALVENGIRLFELKPYDHRSRISLFGSRAASLHTKAFTVDDRAGFVGSMNFDPRSISLNTEMGLVFEDRALVCQIRELFADETSPQKSFRICIENEKIVWQDEVEGRLRTLRDEPRTTFRRKLVARVIGWLPVESQL